MGHGLPDYTLAGYFVQFLAVYLNPEGGALAYF